MDEDVPAEKAVRAAKGADRQLVQAVEVFDVYRGTGLPEGQKSVALAVILQPRDKTLTEAERQFLSRTAARVLQKGQHRLADVAALVLRAATQAGAGQLTGQNRQ